MPRLVQLAHALLPYPVFLRLFTLKHQLLDARREEAARRRLGLPLLNTADLSRLKRSDTVFLLGSGASINQIGEARWRGIARHDSIGFNFWVAHPFVPTMYFLEAIPRDKPVMHEAYLRLASRRTEDYRKVLKVVTEVRGRDGFACPEKWREELYTVATYPVAATSAAEFGQALRYARKRGLFAPSGRVDRLFKQMSTVSGLLGLCARLGYRKIVLCGVDMKDAKYFYQDESLFPETAHLEFMPRHEKHITVVPLTWRVPLDKVVMEIKREVLGPAGIELYVENRGSALWPRIAEAPAALFEAAAQSAVQA